MARKVPRGRPRETDRSKIRDRRIMSAYTEAERAELGELAHEARVSLSEYIHSIVVRYLTRRRKR